MGRAEARRAQKKGRGRSARGRKPKKTGIRRFFTWKKLLAYFFGVIALGVGAFVALYLYVDIPKNPNAAAVAQGNTYQLPGGKVIARDGVNREIVPIEKIPKKVQNAVVAAENKDFWSDPGVDVMGTTRGLLNTVMGRGKQGGSTITQQYVKNYYLDQRQTITRKATELIISLKLQKNYSKEDILAGYLNTSYFGRHAYGIQAASRAYFNKDLDKLTTEESAYLAALLQAPSQYDVVMGTDTGRKNAIARWNYVLDKMVEMDWIKPGERKNMQFPLKDVITPKAGAGLTGQYGYLKALAEDQASQALKKQNKRLADGGYTITLSIDPKKQAALEKAVKEQLTDQLSPKTRKVDRSVQTGAVSVNPKNGKIVALYGGERLDKHWTNNATRSDYQPGSTFKPLIYTSALENGSKTQKDEPINANTIYDGTNQRPVVGPNGDGYAPENEDHHNYGPIPVQRAMNNSVNSVFAQMAVDVGLKDVKKTALSMGMVDDEKRGFTATPALALGSMGASPLEMASAYATLDNHGKQVVPSILESVSRGTEKIDLPSAIGDEVVSRNSADGTTALMKGVVEGDEGTGQEVRNDRYEVAAKTGTADYDMAAWFAGYTPDLVTTVALFGEEGTGGKHVKLYGLGSDDPTKRVNGGGPPAKIWNAYTKAALGDDSTPKFDLQTKDEAGSNAVPSAPPSASPSTEPSHSPPPSRSPSTPPSTPPPTRPTEPSTPPTRPSHSPPPTKRPPTNEPSTPPIPDPNNTDGPDPGTRLTGGATP